MPHTLAANLVHCVFSTKERAAIIPNPDVLCRYITGIVHNLNVIFLAGGGTANHLHLLISVPPSVPLARVMRDIKSNSSRMLRETGMPFAWQEGYGAFSVSYSQRQVVADYIANQAIHHRKWSFEQEFLTLLHRSGIPYDRRLVFG